MDRVTISPVRRGDGGELAALNLANRAYHLPWVEPFTDLAGFETWFSGIHTGAQVSLVARRANEESIVGVLNISQISFGPSRSAFLGFYGMQQCAGLGFMTEGLLQTVRWAFEEIGLNRLEAAIQPDNARSIALVRRAGFQREGFSPRYLKIAGEWRDHERWAVLNPANATPAADGTP